MNKTEFLDKFRQERADWTALVESIGPERMALGGAMGEWTFKDLVAHLTGWRKRTVQRIQAGCGGIAPLPASWPPGASAETEAGTEQINRFIHEQNHDRPLEEVLTESEKTLDNLQEALENLPEDAFADPNCFDWMEGKALGDVDIFGHWHEEHEQDVRQWMTQSETASGQARE